MNNLNEECGIYGVYNSENAAYKVYDGLRKLQHRGQDGAGIVCYEYQQKEYYNFKNSGLVKEVFKSNQLMHLKGRVAIGHVRYATCSDTRIENLQPLSFENQKIKFWICHNGHITNAKKLKQQLIKNNCKFKSTSDSEVLGQLIQNKYNGCFIDTLKESLNQLEGSFAFLIMYNNRIYACRDAYGIRPLVIKKENNEYIISSESVAFPENNKNKVIDIQPGELIEISQDGIIKQHFIEKNKKQTCIMEYIYFADKESIIDGYKVEEIRKNLGIETAKEIKINADLVLSIPNTAQISGVAFASQLGIVHKNLIKKYVKAERTFIKNSISLRKIAAKQKYYIDSQELKNKRVIVIDDSLVRGTTVKVIAEKLNKCGVKEIHIVITSPKFVNECNLGIDVKSKKELICNSYSNTELCQYLKVDSINFLSLKGLENITKKIGICSGCFSGVYPKKTKEYNNI